MTVTITITADTPQEAAKQTAGLLSELGKAYVAFSHLDKTTVGAASKPEAAKVEIDPTPKEVAETEEKKPAKEEKPKKEKAAKPPKIADDSGEEVEETLEGCRTVAMRVAAADGKEGQAGGIQKANALIEELCKRHGVANTLGAMPAECYPEFIANCKKTLGEGATPKSMF